MRRGSFFVSWAPQWVALDPLSYVLAGIHLRRRLGGQYNAILI